MKRFDTAEHIAPILEEIRQKYTPVKDKETLEYLKCTVILDSPKTKEFIAVRENDRSFYYTGNGKSPTVKSLFSDIKSFAEAAETYAGELDKWRYDEEIRVMQALRVALIEEYA